MSRTGLGWLRRLSITARIAIGSLIVAVLFGAVALVGLRLGVAAILNSTSTTLLRADALPYIEALKQNPRQPVDTPVEGQIVAVVGPGGAVLASTLTKGLRPKLHWFTTLDDDSPRHVRTGTAEYLVLSQRVDTPSGSFTVVAARNDETSEAILNRLTVAILIGAAVLVLGFGAASWLLARTALRPVTRMRRQAEALAEETSAAPLAAGPAHDELAELATTLNSLIGRLRASAERERQMVSDASHELRTPLAVLQGQLELAELDAGNADALLTDLRSSRATVLRLSQLATNLLELSRIDAVAGEGTAQAGQASWRELTTELADAIDRARTLAEGEPLAIDFDYAPESFGTAALSARDFGRVLDNLLGNAVAAVRGTSDEGTISAHLERRNGLAVLTIVDSGPGMPEAFIPVAFDRFTRADAARSSYSGGGLGLAIVAALVAAAGGTIALANETPSGLCVEVSLPLS